MISNNLLVILVLFYFFCGYTSICNLIKITTLLDLFIITFVCMYLTKNKNNKEVIWLGIFSSVVLSLLYCKN